MIFFITVFAIAIAFAFAFAFDFNFPLDFSFRLSPPHRFFLLLPFPPFSHNKLNK